jgi:hypothetical protein
VHSAPLTSELAAQRQGELIAAAKRHELARVASAGRPGVVDRLRQLSTRLRHEPAPADAIYRRTWVLARSTGRA